jgi:hypothetical protein
MTTNAFVLLGLLVLGVLAIGPAGCSDDPTSSGSVGPTPGGIGLIGQAGSNALRNGPCDIDVRQCVAPYLPGLLPCLGITTPVDGVVPESTCSADSMTGANSCNLDFVHCSGRSVIEDPNDLQIIDGGVVIPDSGVVIPASLVTALGFAISDGRLVMPATPTPTPVAVCAAGASQTCCPYAGGCGCRGVQDCNENGQWGACDGASPRGSACVLEVLE